MDQFEKLQKLLDNYRKGLMTMEEYMLHVAVILGEVLNEGDKEV